MVERPANCTRAQEGMQSPVLAVAGLLFCIGLFAFFAVLLRLA
jgi:putative membrane protein